MGQQAIIEILAERPAAIRSSREHWWHRRCVPDSSGGIAAEGEIFRFLQQAQQLDLGGWRQVADLIEEKNAVRRPSRSSPDRGLSAPVKAPRRWPKRVSEKTVSSRPATLTATHGRPGRLVRWTCPGDQFLADAALADDQHRLGAGADRLDKTEKGLHAAAAGDDAGEGFRLLQILLEKPGLQVRHRPAAFAQGEGTTHAGQQTLGFRRLDEIVEGPARMQRTAVSTWFRPLRTITGTSGYSPTRCGSSSSPGRCGMVRSSRTRLSGSRPAIRGPAAVLHCSRWLKPAACAG